MMGSHDHRQKLARVSPVGRMDAGEGNVIPGHNLGTITIGVWAEFKARAWAALRIRLRQAG
jgi:hypothetical protein